jgi:hypothetical protein
MNYFIYTVNQHGLKTSDVALMFRGMAIFLSIDVQNDIVTQEFSSRGPAVMPYQMTHIHTLVQ